MTESAPTPSSCAAAAASPPVIEMDGVSVGSMRDPALEVLRDIHWQVAAGDFWAVAGLLASGKTPLMWMMAGLMPPLRGTYRVCGHEFSAGYTSQQVEMRLKVGLVFDGGQLLARRTLAENVALPLAYHADRFAERGPLEVAPLLEFSQIEPLANRYPGEVSRNGCQRAGLARALALRPDILLLDSPLSALDPRQIDWWLERLRLLAAGHPVTGGKPLTIVVTTGDLRFFKGLAKQAALLKGGRLEVCTSAPRSPADLDALQLELLRAEDETISTPL